MNILKLPKQEEVQEFELGNNKVAKVVEVTDENRSELVEIALSMYCGEKCKYCLHEFTSVADLRERDVVYAGYHEHGRVACKSCWQSHNAVEHSVQADGAICPDCQWDNGYHAVSCKFFNGAYPPRR